ncbi:integrase catalytic domain-containing protein [Comamonas testosteroni]|uniref:integrase catalytic domain-containing protein n=1 Tax=Comamonas testosteroni TaxID=285 RepID=UPI001E316252|nr:transposase family protein [Comamonas testosteroni]
MVARLLGFNKNTVQRISRFETLGRVPAPFLLRSDNGPVFTSRSFTALVRSYGLRQEFITRYSPD